MGRKPRSSAGVDAPFDVGAKVEVRCDDDGFRGAWYEATVVRVAPSLRRRRKSYSVVYDSLLVDDDDDPSRHLSEVVPGFHVRPRPPRLGVRAQYALHQLVDAYHNDGWWNGVVAAAGGGGDGGPPERYTVAFHSSREVVEFSTSDIRPHVQWVRGRWVFPDEQAGAQAKYKTGAEVEISCDRENFGAIWLLGVVKKAITKRIYLLEYKKLKEDGGSEVVKEILDVQYIRPKPPTRGAKHLAPLNEVEVFYHGGWSAAVLLKNLEDSKCIVKLKYSEEEIESSQSELRPQREWIDSRWCLPKEKRRRRSSGSGRRPSHPVSVSESSSSDVNNEATCESQWDEMRCNEVGLKRKKEGSNCERQTKLLKPCKLLKKRGSPDQLWKDLGPRTPSGVKEIPAANPNLGSPSNRVASSPCEVPGVLKSTLFENLYPRPSFNGRAEFVSGGEEASKLEVQEPEHLSKAQNLNHSPLGLDTCDFLVAMKWEHDKGVRRPRLNAERLIKKLAIHSPLRQGGLPYIDVQQHAKEISKRKSDRPPKRISTADRLPPTEENSTGRELPQSEGTTDPVVECEQRREDVDACNQGVAGAAPNGNKLLQPHDKVMEHKNSLIADIDDYGVISSQSNEFLVLEKSTCMERQQSEGISDSIIECEQRRKDADACNQGVFGATPNGNKLLQLHDEVMECKNSKLIADLDGNGVISSQSNEHAATMLQRKSLCQGNRLIESLAAPNLVNVSGSANTMGEQMSNVNYGILGEGIETQNKALLPPFNEGSEFMTASSFGTTSVQENSCCYDGLNAGGTEFEGLALLSSHSKGIGGICDDPISSPLQSRRTGNEEGAVIYISRPQLQPVKTVLPFAKSSCLWESIESMEIFRVMPQQPHFRPLEKDCMVHREGRAIGLMVTFANLVANICKLQISDSETKFEETLRALMPLEEYGFDVRSLCSRIERLLKIRNGQWQSKSKRAMLEGQILERENESNQLSESTVEFDESIMELEKRLACLREKSVIAVLQREAKESEIIRLKKDVQILEEDYMSAEQHFGTLKASSWQQ